MRLKRVLCSFVAAGFIAAGHAAAPTQFSSAAGEIRDFVAVNATVGYAATYGGGLWKTSDSGANWAKTSLPAQIVWKVSVNAASAGARIYAATNSGIYRSTDSGATWTQLTQDPTRAVAVSPGSAAGGPDTVLFGVRGVGILKTTDSGTTITRTSSGLDSTDVLGITYFVGSSTIAYAVLQCNVEDAPAPLSGNWGGVFRSADGGATWAAMNTGLDVVDSTKPCVNAIAANGTFVVAGIKDYSTNSGGIYFINGSGTTTWVKSSTTTTSSGGPYGVEFLGPDISNASGFFIGSNQFGLWRSADGGNTFGQVYSQATDPDVETIGYAAGAFSSTVWVTGVSGIGLFRTTTGGSPWSLPTTPIRADRVNDLTSHEVGAPSIYYMAVAKGSVMKSTNSGVNWAEFDAGLGTSFAGTNNNIIRDAQVVGGHPNNGNIVGLGLRPFGLYQLTSGTTWTQVTGFSNAADHKPQSIAISPLGRVYYSLFDFPNGGTAGGLYVSNAGSDIGTLTPTGFPQNVDGNPGAGVAPGAGRVRISPSQPESRAFLMMYDSLPYLTTNGGVNWTRVIASDSGGFQRLAFNDMAEKPASALVVLAASNKGIYRSTDGGAHLSRLPTTGLNQTALAALVYASNNVIFGGDFSGQMYCSADDGATWLAVTGGNLGYSIKNMKNMNGSIHVLTDGGGFWKKDGVCP